MIRLAALAVCAAVPLSGVAAAATPPAPTAAYAATGHCRDGQPHGAYELRTASGQLRVAGAFNRGKREGSFLFWSSAGARIAQLPYDADALSGTVALWYSQPGPTPEPRRKLEAVYAGGVPAGTARSWYRDGHPRAEFRYDGGMLADVRAWSAKGESLPETEARSIAARDRAEDERLYNTLEAIVRDNPPRCEPKESRP